MASDPPPPFASRQSGKYIPKSMVASAASSAMIGSGQQQPNVIDQRGFSAQDYVLDPTPRVYFGQSPTSSNLMFDFELSPLWATAQLPPFSDRSSVLASPPHLTVPLERREEAKPSDAMGGLSPSMFEHVPPIPVDFTRPFIAEYRPTATIPRYFDYVAAEDDQQWQDSTKRNGYQQQGTPPPPPPVLTSLYKNLPAPGIVTPLSSVEKPVKRARTGEPEDVEEEKDEATRPMSTPGEYRLKIHFEDFGLLGVIPQRFGKSDHYVPDRLRGTHEVYSERWRFEIRHHLVNKHLSVVVEWIIVNLASGMRVSRTETTKEAFVRQTKGRTICNRVLRSALEDRVKELEAEMLAVDDDLKRSNIQDKITALRPTRCLVGLLFFGLLHKQVQDRLHEAIQERQPASAALSAASSTEEAGFLNQLYDPMASLQTPPPPPSLSRPIDQQYRAPSSSSQPQGYYQISSSSDIPYRQHPSMSAPTGMQQQQQQSHRHVSPFVKDPSSSSTPTRHY